METQEYKVQRLKNFDGIQLKENSYNLTIGLVLLFGILINTVMARFFSEQILNLPQAAVFIAYFVLGIGGTMIVFKSRKPAVSFGGFIMLSVGMGLLLTYILTMYSGHTIYTAFLMTGIVTVSMMIVSTLFPSFFLGLGKTLGLSLLIAIAVELVGVLIFRLDLGIMDYIMVIIFSGYVGYDWAKAQVYPKTLDNAIDSAADIYVDIINLFIRILSIVGKKND
jgi:FtsH-binding integral membrane protein